jgi:hypothetical protein
MVMKPILATAAMLFLLLRPVCDALAAGATHDERGQDTHTAAHQDARGGSAHGHDVPCCADLGDGAVAKLGEPAAVRVTGESKPALAAAAWTAMHYTGAVGADARQPPRVLFTTSSFYARSARIRR